MSHKISIAVALSGGVDSSLSAWLLKEAGYKVKGLTLDLLGGEQTQAAARTAAELDMELKVIDARQEFSRLVIRPTAGAYGQGLTPNPCVVCNARLKLPFLWEHAHDMGCNMLATGHYARLVQHDGRRLLAEGVDAAKSQAYFLARVEQELLEHLMFPLGDKTKEQVRQLAQAKGLSAAQSRESQDCCFVPPEGFGPLVERYAEVRPGIIENSQGRILARHQGLHKFTIGQRRGLNISADRPLYVTALDKQRAAVRVGYAENLLQKRVRGEQALWYMRPDANKPLSVRIRYARQGHMGRVLEMDGHNLLVELEEACRGVAPGQLMVFNQGDLLVGSAWISPLSFNDPPPAPLAGDAGGSSC